MSRRYYLTTKAEYKSAIKNWDIETIKQEIEYQREIIANNKWAKKGDRLSTIAIGKEAIRKIEVLRDRLQWLKLRQK